MYPCRTAVRKYLLNINMHYSIEDRGVFGLLRSVVESCGRCGRAVSAPLRLTDLSRRPSEETYYACPFCFSRLDVEDVAEHLERSHAQVGVSSSSSIEALGSQNKKSGGKNTDVISNCSREFGYLRSRPKDSAIPDECLICPRILQCMVRST